MAKSATLNIYIWIPRWVFLFGILTIHFGLNSACPSVCECKWKGGKQTVECRNRGLITLPSNVDPETQVLDLSGSNLQILPREAFMRANLLNLQKIYLQGCRIGQIDPTAFRGLTNLVELDLSDNILTDIPSETFRDAPSLRELRLNNNPIQKIEDRAFEFLPGLVKLDLSECQIQNLASHAFEGLEQLSHLRMGGNRLTELKPRVISALTRLHGIELHNNPWICDCRLRHMRDWLQQHNIPTPVAATCTLPKRLNGKTLQDLQLDEFACPPEVISTTNHQRYVESTNGENATLSCRMSAIPEPEITWLWRGRPIANTSLAEMAANIDGYAARIIMITEEGSHEKTSHLSFLPVRETDAGEFVCVAANRAGLAKINFTLTVENRPPVAGGFGSAQIAGLGAGLFLLLALAVAIFLLLLIRCRRTVSKSDCKEPRPIANHNGIHGTESEHKLAARSPVNYADTTFLSTSNNNAAENNPDLIHEARKAAEYWQMSENDISLRRNNCQSSPQAHSLKDEGYQYPQQSKFEFDSEDNADAPRATYHSSPQESQHDKLYSPNLWPRGMQSEAANAIIGRRDIAHNDDYESATLHLPHIPVKSADHTSNSSLREVHSYADGETESISIDSYSLPCRMPQHEPLYGSVTYVPYPSDYGLPRNQSPMNNSLLSQTCTLPSIGTLGRSQTHLTDHSLPSSYGSRANASTLESMPGSIESSPASSAKSPRFWHRPAISNKRSFARDSPDEGYQEECATDV